MDSGQMMVCFFVVSEFLAQIITFLKVSIT